MPDEYVLRSSAARAIGYDKLNQLNAMGNRKAAGGLSGIARPAPSENAGKPMNIYVVTPDQKPVPGPQDIIAIVDDNIARGGSTKKLIKTVSTGDI